MDPFTMMLLISAGSQLISGGTQMFLQNEANRKAGKEASRLAGIKRDDDLKQAGILNALGERDLALGRDRLAFNQDQLDYSKQNIDKQMRLGVADQQYAQGRQALDTFSGQAGSHLNLGNLKRSAM